MAEMSGRNGLLLLFIHLFVQPTTTRAFTLGADSRPGEAVSSHSGPTNALYGHEQFHDEPLSEEQRHKRNAMWGNNFFFNQNNGWPSLLVSSEPPSMYMKGSLTGEHNRYRRMVPATDMRMIYWSEELAASAQRHANRCDFRHSRDRVNVGENIWAAPYTNYSDAIVRWFDEVNNPRCGCSQGYKHCCGHYIQLVWARTNLVGCGYARCRDVWGVLGRGHQNVFVCHYNPQGNRVFVNGNGQMLAAPAFTWAYNRGQVCSQCPEDAPACYDGLCYMPENYAAPNKNATTTFPNANNHKGYRWVETNDNSQQNGGGQGAAQNGSNQQQQPQQNSNNNSNGSNTTGSNNNSGQNGNNDAHRMGNQWDSQSKTENNRISQNTVE
ncbi:Protein lon-1 [Aphelenchoides fujianensis]|nr:Protein lon-1 [Aphelenchoides fujianensis]